MRVVSGMGEAAFMPDVGCIPFAPTLSAKKWPRSLLGGGVQNRG